MKHMNKILALALALIMILGLATTASAAETYTLTLNGAQAGHTYTAYQIFDGDLSDSTLSNIVWGPGVSAAGQEALGNAAAKAAAITTVEQAEVFAAEVAPYLATVAGSVTIADNADSGEITGLDAGYYLVQTTATTDENGVYTSYIMKIVKDTSATIKADVPEVEKKVKDTNDSTGETTGWQDSADYDIGDTVPFKLTATLPNNYADYSVYKLAFNDTFTHFENVAITDVYLANANGEKISDFADNDYSYVPTTNGFTVTFANLKTSSIAAQIGNSMKIVVEYTAVLANSANIGSLGNPNEVYLEYSNNPNWVPEYDEDGNPENPGDTPTGETPKDKVIVFTYELDVDKVDQNGAALKGAGFTLFKKTGETETKNEQGETVKVPTWTQIGNEVKGEDLTKFVFKGLDDGMYKLVETTTPAGYNTIEPIEFTITATHEDEADDPQLLTLETTLPNGSADEKTGIITGTVMNQAGTVLPETGGMGTILFYALGGLLVAAAVVLLVTKKRMSSAQ